MRIPYFLLGLPCQRSRQTALLGFFLGKHGVEKVKVTHVGLGYNVSRRTTRVLRTNAGKLAVSQAWLAQDRGHRRRLAATTTCSAGTERPVLCYSHGATPPQVSRPQKVRRLSSGDSRHPHHPHRQGIKASAIGTRYANHPSLSPYLLRCKLHWLHHTSLR